MRERKEEKSTDNTHGSFWEASTGSTQARNKKTALRNPNQASAQKVREASKKAREESKGSTTSFV